MASYFSNYPPLSTPLAQPKDRLKSKRKERNHNCGLPDRFAMDDFSGIF